jgi:hypothetical protein
MSLSNPKTSNPANKFIEWSGSRGQFEYYDKEEAARVKLETPIYIVVLDQLTMFTGFDEPNNCGIYSNEVGNSLKEKIVIRSHKGGVMAEGLYADIKDKVKGANYTKSVYACLISPKSGNLELVNFKFTGSSIGAWIDCNVKDDGCVIVLDSNPEIFKKGKVEFYQPTVTKSKRRDDILDKAKGEDISLQAYLKSYKQQDATYPENDTKATVIDEPTSPGIDDLPF